MKRTLGVCYYPEHWNEDLWAEDAARMVAAGLTHVRIGEFAWSRIEPQPDTFRWGWLDRAMDVLDDAGLRIVLGTPTATPPRWMIDRYPDMIAVDARGNPRKFGSRRHYDFSHLAYREESRRIAGLMAERYGSHPGLDAWQIDNEYACHDTVESFSLAATIAFRDWLAQRYQSPEALNRAWGNVFWSMEVSEFDEIDPPNLTVTEPNPAHVLAWRRFSSDQVVAYNRAQAEAIRSASSAPLCHNYMGRITDFDHWDLGNDLDFASWDSYPIGFLSDRLEGTAAFKAEFLRQGHPDNQAFHHDLYRAVGKGRWWVMEQQPGPVNWAPWNPAPLPGMCRLWAWEAFAHGASCVSFFRWRQAPFAQEQMHAGLLRPDSADAPALAEVRQVADELAETPDTGTARGDVAIVFDYVSAWAWAAQPQGADFDYFRLVFAAYRACRRAGLNVDILPPDMGDLSGWPLVLVPGLMTLDPALRAALAAHEGAVLIGPRTDTKTPEMSIALPLGPDIPGLDARVVLTESLPPGIGIGLSGGGHMLHWLERIEGSAPVIETLADGSPAIVGTDALALLAGWPDDDTFYRLIAERATALGLEVLDLPPGLRCRRTDRHRYWFNYGAATVSHGGRTIGPADLLREPL